MKIMLETTEWSDPGVPNHVYVFNDAMSRIIGYVKAGTKEVFRFKQPLTIDRRGRTFVELEDDQPQAPKNHQWQFQGSKGAVYTVSKVSEEYICTCPGFTFRGHCKHVAEKQQEQQ